MRSTDIIERRYRDALGRMHTVGRETVRRIETVLHDEAPREDPVRIVRCGQRVSVDSPADVILEDGRRESLQGSRLPSDLPLGYHTLEFHDTGRRVSLIVAPNRCHLPKGLRIWGWAVQLYALRSRRSWGIGDFADLARLADGSFDRGCGLLLVNPLHSVAPVLPQQASPYSPTTRRFLNPLYLSIHQLPGARELPELAQLDRMGARLNARPLVERDRIFELKMRALEALYKRFDGSADFDAFLIAEGPSLREYAAYCVLAETYGANWRQWPAALRHPRSADVRRFVDAHPDRVRFHEWVQWCVDRQLRAAATIVPVMQDLPIGFDPDGADAWAWQDVLAPHVSVGAPPDEFNTKGQNWGLPPFVPGKLRRAQYRPFIETIRGTMRYAGGLRIDHAVGLFHLFWIPEGMSPAEGAYVRNNADDLLAIIALESERAQAIVCGEDLGTVSDDVKRRLMAKRILSYRLLWFEKCDPSQYPEQALAAVTTHDLPTIAGLWTGSDLEAQQRLGLNPNVEGTREIRDRLAALTHSRDATPVRDVVARTYSTLARASSVVVSATLEDAMAVEARPNMPGTVTECPNWSRPLPLDVDSFCRSPEADAIARTIGRGRRSVRAKRARRRKQTRKETRAA